MKFAMYLPDGKITRIVTMPPDMDPIALNGESFVQCADDVKDTTHRVDGGVVVLSAVPAVFVSFSFTYAGKQIDIGDGERLRMALVTGVIYLTGALPAGWPGTWPAVDGTTIPIPDVAAWRDFFSAVVAQVV